MSTRVVVDAMGGDFGPAEIVKGAMHALLDNSRDLKLILVGDRRPLMAALENYNVEGKPVTTIFSSGKIGDEEHPAQALRKKPDASIAVAMKLLLDREADAVVSMGSTGATMASAVHMLGTFEGVNRPCIGGPFLGLAPKTVLVDLGSNVDCRPSHLLNFAAMGTVFARTYLKIHNPRVGLLNTGTEAAKGNRQVQEAYPLLEKSGLNFIGNMEGGDFFTGRADVIVGDGFTGNVLLKFTEQLGLALRDHLRLLFSSDELADSFNGLAREIVRVTNPARIMGGAPLFGVPGTVIVGHGSSKADQVAEAIKTASSCVQLGLHENMRDELAKIHSRPGNGQ